MSDITYNLTSTTNITKEFILSKVSEEEIFEHYGIKVQKGLFCSKIRQDKRPTVSFYRNKSGRLIMHDFGDSSFIDCFAYVQILFNTSYYMALQIIANDFKLISRPDLSVNKAKIKYSGTKIDKTETSRIQVEIRDWDNVDLAWWAKYGIKRETLDKFKIYPCKTVWLNGNIFFVFTGNERCYGYFGGIKEGIEYWRIYFPGRRSYKFVGNWKSTQIQGAHMLSKDGGDDLVITKSLKDVAVLYEYGITAIAPCSENVFITDAQYQKLKTKFKNIYLNYDNDEAGLKAMCKIKKQYPELKVLFLPRHGGDKDISDFRKAHGHKKTLDLINNIKECYAKKEKCNWTTWAEIWKKKE